MLAIFCVVGHLDTLSRLHTPKAVEIIRVKLQNLSSCNHARQFTTLSRDNTSGIKAPDPSSPNVCLIQGAVQNVIGF